MKRDDVLQILHDYRLGNIKTADEAAELIDMLRGPFVLEQLRENGWSVAVHNDYRLDGVAMTFWLMTHSAGLFLKGEGLTDIDALKQIEQQARKVFAPSP